MKAKALLRPLIVMTLMLIMLLSWTVIQSDMVYAGEETTYTVFIYSGKEGYFGTPGNTMIKVEDISFGSEFTIDLKAYGLVIKDEEQYYPRGVKDTGHDNDETYNSYTFPVVEDMSFTVAYGMRGGMVEYTVNYVSEDGTVLHEPETFWGMPGDKPVVSYRRVEGYLPNQYNEAKTLTDKASDNVFTFTYRSLTSGEAEAVEGTTGGTTAQGDQAQPGTEQGGESIDNAGTPQAQPGEIVDLDDTDTPTSEGSFDEGDTVSAENHTLLYILLGGIAAAIVTIVLQLTRKKKQE